MCKIRLLRADEIDVRVQQVTEKGAVLLLYKDARADMAILDEVFGMCGWQREHSFKDDKNYCKVSIWDKEKNQWISKEDVGTASKTEAQKGEASDAFKRACTNVGIGRELYTSPFLWVAVTADEIYKKGDKWAFNARVKFSVKEIGYENRNISRLVIVDQDGKIRYDKGKRVATPAADPIAAAQPAAPAERKPLLMEHLADDTKWKQLMDWVYNAHSLAKDATKFDPVAWLKERRTVADDVAAVFKEKYFIDYAERQSW